MFPFLAMLSSVAYSLSFGEAKVRSIQGQALQVRIALNDTRGYERLDIDVKQILGAKAGELGFAGAALDLAYTIELISNGRGDLWVDISSDEPFTEPYTQFLLQLESSDERLLSEYRVSVPSVASKTTYLIKPGDSLGRIAQALRPDEAIQLQAIVQHLHVNNLQAFAQGDINRIVVGARLSLPSASDYSAMPRRDLKPVPAVAVMESPESVNTSEKDLSVNTALTPYVVEPVTLVEQTRVAEKPSASIADAVDTVKEGDVAELEWVELGAVEAPEVVSVGEPVEPSTLNFSKNTAVHNRTVLEVVPNPLNTSKNLSPNAFYYSAITKLQWLLIPLIIIFLTAIFIVRHYWRFDKKAEISKSSVPCEKIARVLALEKKLARQQAYKKIQAAKKLAAKQRVREHEAKLTKIQQQKNSHVAKGVKNIEQTAVKEQSAPIESSTELPQVKARADLSVNSAEMRAQIQSKPAKKSSPVVGAAANNPEAQSQQIRDAEDEQTIDEFYKLLDRD